MDAAFFEFAFADRTHLFNVLALVCIHLQNYFICQTFGPLHQMSQIQELQQTSNMSQHKKNRGQLICTLMLLETTEVQKTMSAYIISPELCMQTKIPCSHNCVDGI